MHPVNCGCIVCLVDRSSFGTPEAKALRDSVSDEKVARVLARTKELDAERRRDAMLTILVSHAKECSSDVCAACDCGWDGDAKRITDYGGLFVHAEHLADVLVGGDQ